MPTWWETALGIGREPSADQQEAITAPHTGRRSVNAGAGTGKTSTLALRALALIESAHVRADQIVVVTFTKKAAGEIGARIADTIDRAIANGAAFDGHGRGVRCTTIHALASEILREFALDFGFVTAPRSIADGEAYGVFHEAFVTLLEGRLDVDTGAFPIGEISLGALERDLGKLALRCKNHGIAPSDFAARALAESERFRKQTWGQLWTPGARENRKTLDPKEPVSAAALEIEAAREARNVRVVAALFAEFDRLLHARGVATYGDLIGLTTQHLGRHPEIVARLRARYRYVLLDESQDTSAMQLRFIETLFGAPGEPDAAGMMPVGDTRQAIYGFNGADEGVMARIAAVSESTHPLTINRRSPQEIVDAAHAVLVRAGAIDPATPLLTASAGAATLACVRVQNFGVDGGSVKDHVRDEAAAIAREVERLLGDSATATKPSDVAILVRRRTHAAAYVRALNLRGIAAALDRRSGLFAADEVRDAIAWMSWLADLTDRQAAVRILQSPLCGLSDAATIALAASKDWLERFLRDEIDPSLDADTRERLARVRALLVGLLPIVSLPLPLAMRRFASDLPIAASYARIGETVGAQAIVNLRSFGALADEFARERPHARVPDFTDDVKRRILYDDEPQEAELDLDGVRVMTIHQAKGLEWPYVFVACVTKTQYGTAGPSDAVVKYDLDTGALALKNDIDGRETFRWLCIGTEHDPDTGERVLPPGRKTLAEREQARVFYVAVTRARRRVYVTAPAPAPPGRAAQHASYIDAIRAWAENVEAGVDLSFDTAVEGATERQERPPMRRPAIEGVDPVAPSARLSPFRPRVSFTSVSTFQECPRKARLRYRLRVPELREERPRFVGVSEYDGPAIDARRLGSLTHRTLELWGTARLRGEPGDLDGAFAGAMLEFAETTAAEAADARRRAGLAVDALANFEIVAVERTFEMAVGDAMLEGAIDLVARAADGKLWVIDYKTGHAGDETYALQLALYRHAAMRDDGATDVTAAILRLSPTTAVMTTTPNLPYADLAAQVAEAGAFESDIPRVGAWCRQCRYDGSPCTAAGPR